MALTSGTRLGVYEVIAPIGEGGMGQVYRARDTTLNRDVALKILPDAFARDPDRLARFTREAQTLASLNHPNIAAIYGIEESQHVRALVMELVGGEDLSAHIGRGPIPLAEALPIARQIADALEAAHEQGIIHRDLKPANIKMRADGTVKVLDFGLAKAMEPASVSASAMSSPTVTTPAMTLQGVILGTAAYMAPEQAKGRAVDKRADIWAFGVVLYEMLTGRRLFDAEDMSETLAAVLTRDVSMTTLPAAVPARLRALLRDCLIRDPRQRLRDIGDARIGLEQIIAGAPGDVWIPASGTGVVPSWRRALPWASTVALAAGLAAVLMLWAPWRTAAPPRITRMTITPSGAAALTINRTDGDLALTPDGTHVVYIGNNGTQIFVRALDALEPVAIASGSALRGPFVSPDGQWVGFLDGVITLRKVAITGGPPTTLARLDGASRGATWAPDDTIIFATVNPATGLQRLSAAGGTPEVLTRPDRARGEAGHFWPEILPGGRAVLFTIMAQTGGLDTAQVAVRDLRTGTQKVLLRGGSHGHYVASGPASSKPGEDGLASTKPGEGGHLVYVAAGTLRAIPFDPTRLETHGTGGPVLQRLVTKDTGTGDFAVAADGMLVYVDVPGGLAAANAHTLVWVDRTGKEEPIAAPPRAYVHPRLSPDGTRVALYSFDQENDIWIWDLRRATLTPLTLDPAQDWFPVWEPDGRRIIFSSNRGGGPFNLWRQAADGTGVAERLTTSSQLQLVTGITPDGTAVVFNEQTLTMGSDLMQLALDGTRPSTLRQTQGRSEPSRGTTGSGRGEPVEPRRVTPLLQTKFDERNGVVSPDGRWLAYESNSSGPFEIYVRPFPNVGSGQWQVSTAGGTRPLWARSGKELFYVGNDGALLRVPVEASGATWNAGTPIKLLEGRYYTSVGSASSGRAYDVSPDGQRFLMIKSSGTAAGAAPPALIVVQHWDEELKRLVPTK